MKNALRILVIIYGLGIFSSAPLQAEIKLDPRSRNRATPGAPAATPPASAPVPAPSTAPGAPGAQAEQPEIRDIAEPVDVFPYPPWMVALAGTIALGALGLLAWAAVRLWNKQPAPPAPTARQVALRELEALRAEIQAVDPYAFSITVSAVLRRFIGRHFGLQALRQTSPEFLASVADSPRFSKDECALLAGFLETCDMIKFARISATQEESGQLLTNAIAFVQGAQA